MHVKLKFSAGHSLLLFPCAVSLKDDSTLNVILAGYIFVQVSGILHPAPLASHTRCRMQDAVDG